MGLYDLAEADLVHFWDYCSAGFWENGCAPSFKRIQYCQKQRTCSDKWLLGAPPFRGAQAQKAPRSAKRAPREL